MSNAREIRMYYKELLRDAAEHSRAELLAYAKQRNPEANYTEGMLSGALKTLVDGNQNYISVGRGIYKLNTDTTVTNGGYIEALIQKYNEILKEAIEKMENEITVNPFLLLEVGEGDVSRMRKIQRCMDTMKQTVECINENQI